MASSVLSEKWNWMVALFACSYRLFVLGLRLGPSLETSLTVRFEVAHRSNLQES